MAVRSENLFAQIPSFLSEEQVLPLVTAPCVKIERIVSTGQASPPGFWYDQAGSEWVVLLAGSAGVLIAGETKARTLRPGDFLDIPAHTMHRVEWTDAAQPTVWLAVHFEPAPTL